MIDLSVLEDRVLHVIPEEYHRDVEEEFTRFGCEINRMSSEEDKIGQATLTQSEIDRLPPMGNQNTDRLTLIEYQVIKGHSLHYGVYDWISILDSTLSCEENCEIMRLEGTENGRTMREMEMAYVS